MVHLFWTLPRHMCKLKRGVITLCMISPEHAPENCCPGFKTQFSHRANMQSKPEEWGTPVMEHKVFHQHILLITCHWPRRRWTLNILYVSQNHQLDIMSVLQDSYEIGAVRVDACYTNDQEYCSFHFWPEDVKSNAVQRLEI